MAMRVGGRGTGVGVLAEINVTPMADVVIVLLIELTLVTRPQVGS